MHAFPLSLLSLDRVRTNLICLFTFTPIVSCELLTVDNDYFKKCRLSHAQKNKDGGKKRKAYEYWRLWYFYNLSYDE